MAPPPPTRFSNSWTSTRPCAKLLSRASKCSIRAKATTLVIARSIRAPIAGVLVWNSNGGSCHERLLEQLAFAGEAHGRRHRGRVVCRVKRLVCRPAFLGLGRRPETETKGAQDPRGMR